MIAIEFVLRNALDGIALTRKGSAMRKCLFLIVAALVGVASYQIVGAQNNDQRPTGRILQDARTQDGRIDLSKIEASTRFPENRKEEFRKADADGDGFLSQEELHGVFNAIRGDQGGEGRGNGRRGDGAPQERRGQGRRAPQGDRDPQGRPGAGRPGMGQPGPMGMQRPGFAEAMEDGKLNLSKLPETFPPAMKETLQNADKDGDGFLTIEEMRAMPRPKFQFPEGKKPDFLNDDNAFIVEKTIETLKKADEDGNGVINEEEQRAVADYVRENYPAFPLFLNQALSARTQFGFPGFGGPGMQGRPNGDRGPQGRREGDRDPQARPNGDRGPQGQPGGERMRQPGGFGFFGNAMTDGKLELAKLPENMPQEMKDNFKKADKDADGFVSMEEMRNLPRPKFQFPEGSKPEFVNDEGDIDVEKLIEAIKKADKNEDGIIDEAELKDLADLIREKSPMLPLFINRVLGAQQGFGFGAPGFGGGPGFGGRPGFGGPNGPRPGGEGQPGSGPRGPIGFGF